MQKGTVKTVVATAPWMSGQNVQYFGFMYTMENGDKGEASHVKNEPKYPTGTEIDYEVFMSPGGRPKIKFETPSVSYAGKPKKAEFSNAGMALRFATDFSAAAIKSKPEIDLADFKKSLFALADMNLKWLNENSN